MKTRNFTISRQTNQLNYYLVLLFLLFSTTSSLGQSLKGDPFTGKENNDEKGSGIDMSFDGNIVAIGTPGFNVGETDLDRGVVRVYEWNSMSFRWKQKGNDIYGVNSGDNAGRKVALSADGLTLAVGIELYDHDFIANAEQNQGAIQVYTFSGLDWVPKGDLILGESERDALGGTTISLSADGNTLVAGTPFPGGLFSTNPGYVKVFEFDGLKGNFVQKGQMIINNERSFGRGLDISADGSRIAVGAPFVGHGTSRNVGSLHIYEYNVANTSWDAITTEVYGESNGANLGIEVSMNAAGTRVAAGMPESGNTDTGKVRVYDINDTGTGSYELDLVGSEINGSTNREKFGDAVSISDSGDRVLVGAPFNNERDSKVGSVRLFELNATSNWVQLGSDIDGDIDTDDEKGGLMGTFVSLSGNGNFAVSTENEYSSKKGRVSVYECLSTNASVNYKKGNILATREELDGVWTNYYDSDNNWLLSIKKNGEDIGTVGDGEFAVKIITTENYGESFGKDLSHSAYAPDNEWYVINRKWDVQVGTGKQPNNPVGVKFPFMSQDFKDLHGSTSDVKQISNMIFYKVKTEADPHDISILRKDIQFIQNGSTPDLETWVHTKNCGKIHNAEFTVDSFSGGSAGYGTGFDEFLPVDLVSFTGKSNNADAFLNWTTATELNNSHFEVQMSVDGINFSSIGKVIGNGTTREMNNYNFKHANIGNTFTKVYYRLKQVDFNGEFEYSNIVELKFDDSVKQHTISIYPNPIVGDEVSILNAQNSDVSIYNASGQLVFKDKLSSSIENKLDVTHLSKGFYIIRVLDEKGKSRTVKMIK